MVFLGIASNTPAANLVRDAGFEAADPAWEFNPVNMRNGAVARIDPAQGRDGGKCLVLEQTRPLELPKGWQDAPKLLAFISENKAGGLAAVRQSVPVEEGRSYNFRFWYKSQSLVRERKDNPKQGYAAFQVHVDWFDAAGKPIAGKQGTFWVLNEQLGSEGEWVRVVNNHFNKGPWRSYIAPQGAKAAAVRFTLSTMQPDVTPRVCIDDVQLEDEDTADDTMTVSGAAEFAAVPNAGFEDADGDAPKGWKSIGSGKAEWAKDARTGIKSVGVSDAGTGPFSGWSTDLPVRLDREYSLSGWIKTGAMSPYGDVTGAALCLQFLDADGQKLGEQVLSEIVAANSDWKESRTRFSKPPAGATTVRVVAGLQFIKGTAWFDDLSLTMRQQKQDVIAHVLRASPKPSEGVRYAPNLLTNGDVEKGEGDKPAGWTYVGSAEKNWTPEQIAAFYRENRPPFSIGRGRGTWSRELVYSGSGALLNASIDPPLSTNMQWYGRNPVDGYWLSDPMKCEARKAYLAGGWIRPGAMVRQAWNGPLEIKFFDGSGKEISGPNLGVRPGIVMIPAGEWSYWATLPYVAPEQAVTMRLRFGQELAADAGGWGKTYADNLAVWELPEGVSAEKTQDHALQTEHFWEWFRSAHKAVKPPYLAAPTDAQQYLSCQGRVENTVPGNLFSDRSAKVPLRVVLNSQIGETRKVTLQLQRFDWVGNSDEPVEVKDVELQGYGEAVAEVTLPASGSYGTFYIDGKIREANAIVGTFSGRYGVLPPLERKHTVDNIWAVTTLMPFYGDGRPSETELGHVMKVAGFGLSWINIAKGDDEQFSKTLREVEWYRSLGIRPILRINPLQITRPIDPKHFEALGARLATVLGGKVAAFGNWGVEQANPRTVKAPVFRPIINGQMLTDEEYDIILGAIYDGIKSVDQKTPVLIGNIATDHEGVTVRRLYEKPAAGRFDGAITNAYSASVKLAQSVVKEFDKHGDNHKAVWQEETMDQMSPHTGPARRRGEAEGARNLVRVWVTMKAVIGPRLKAMTMWGFAYGHMGGESEIVMMSTSLQPRPHFAAHAIMADALADAVFDADLSQGNLAIYRWNRTDGPLLTLWASSGERSITLEVPTGELTVMDLVGNRTQLKAAGGVISLSATTSPIYVFGGGDLKISKRLETKLEHGTTRAGEPQVRVTVTNQEDAETIGEVAVSGPVVDGDTPRPFKLGVRQSVTMLVSVQAGLPDDRRSSFTAGCTTSDGGVYVATAALNFAMAVQTPTPPALDGTWTTWSAAPLIEFGTRPSQVFKGYGHDGEYTGVEDVSGKFRMLWDDKRLYLGVEALDDSFFTQPERGLKGFMADSIEFAVQPDAKLSPHAPYWEFELYLPDAKPPYAASRRTPGPKQLMTEWHATIAATGERGNAIYQAAIPWTDLGIAAPKAGKTFSFALVLNDADVGERMTGARTRVRWFEGIDLRKTPENFGDVTLVAPRE